MDRPAPGLRLEAITPPRQEIMRIWRTFRPVDRSFIQGIIGDVVMLIETPVDWIFLRTAAEFWDPQHAVFNLQGTEVAPTIEEYTALVQRPTPTTQGIFVPNPFEVIRSQLSTLLGIPVQEVHQELHQGWDHGVRIAWLSDWTLLRALTPSTGSYQRDACHGFLLLIFGTLLFPYAPNLIDRAIAQVVLQAVGGHSYVEALLAETIQSLDYVREVRRCRMKGSPHLLQVWLLAHIRPFCSSHAFSYIADERSLIERLLLWVARWNLDGPMIMGCSRIVGVPLLSHLGSTLIFPVRVIRQLGGLQDIPAEADRLPHRIQWADSTSTGPARFLQIREIHRQRDSSTIQRLYFPEHPTDEERALSATRAPDGASSSTRPDRNLRPRDGLLERYVRPSASKGAAEPPIPRISGRIHFALARTYAAFSRPPSAKGCRLTFMFLFLPCAVFYKTMELESNQSEQERRLKRMEETIRGLQANEARPDARYGECSLFLGMRLPSKVKIPDFRIYKGTTDLRYHLRNYQEKMLQYWDYEEFVIHSFQDSLSGSALDWFMSLKAEDIPTWEDLSRKFIDQYQYCAETPPTLLELSMKKMMQGQKFEEYATKWRAQAAKHIPPFSEVQQIQSFHSTLRGLYYSHLLAHTSSFSDLIEAGKKLDLGIKLGRMEGPTVKGEESAKRASAMPASSSGRRGKEVSINAVNPAHPMSQQYSIN
ncbi:hypothetical protein CRG98_003745 [Punica granatum]|uniref:Uncharacterized protein n=1 Tax=Punica granatum TaxID=22663 RepID=A0A2I0L5D3_PUNGR|nr:hypothetical protein CRG98_003745 [Punica granatum]